MMKFSIIVFVYRVMADSDRAIAFMTPHKSWHLIS